MIELHLANTPRLALYANAVANLADGEFLQTRAPDRIAVLLPGAVTIARDQLTPVTGRPPDDDVWAALAAPPVAGRQLAADATRIRLDIG
jgi:hypothetical protein